MIQIDVIIKTDKLANFFILFCLYINIKRRIIDLSNSFLGFFFSKAAKDSAVFLFLCSAIPKSVCGCVYIIMVGIFAISFNGNSSVTRTCNC